MIDLSHRRRVGRALSAYVQQLDIEKLAAEQGTPLLVFDVDRLRSQYRTLQTALPGINHYYAVKALPHPAAIRAIKQLDGYLDLATDGEIAMAQSAGFAMDHCMHTHPIKKAGEIARAVAAGIKRFVVDNPNEVEKFADYGDQVELMVRLSHHDPEAVVNLAYKFGASQETAKDLVALALRQGNRIAGLCMHVGSQIQNPQAYVTAIRQTVTLVDELEATHGITITTLDIGGGFPVDYRSAAPTIKTIAGLLIPCLEPLRQRFTIQTEPGRFVAAPSMIAVSSVVGVSHRHGEPWYYIDDGLYNSYSLSMFDGNTPHLFAFQELTGTDDGTTFDSTVAGPTCDSVDIVTKQYPLPRLQTGDLLLSPMMGAYTTASATTFNSLPQACIVVLHE